MTISTEARTSADAAAFLERLGRYNEECWREQCASGIGNHMQKGCATGAGPGQGRAHDSKAGDGIRLPVAGNDIVMQFRTSNHMFKGTPTRNRRFVKTNSAARIDVEATFSLLWQ